MKFAAVGTILSVSVFFLSHDRIDLARALPFHLDYLCPFFVSLFVLIRFIFFDIDEELFSLKEIIETVSGLRLFSLVCLFGDDKAVKPCRARLGSIYQTAVSLPRDIAGSRSNVPKKIGEEHMFVSSSPRSRVFDLRKQKIIRILKLFTRSKQNTAGRALSFSS
jgi:hypothetical protein